jgi:hypothetical protein
MLRARLHVLLRALASLVLNGNGHELVGTRLVLEVVIRWPRRALEGIAFTTAFLAYALVLVAVVDVSFGLGIFPE